MLVGVAQDPAKLTKVSVSLPFGLGAAEWQPDPVERRAAWALYVELTTRVALQPVDLDHGLIREALTSLHALFAVTRHVLREAGPDVGGPALSSVGGAAIAVLNRGIRPFLAKWHPLLLAWEQRRPPEASARDHERGWTEEARIRGELERLRTELGQYAETLAKIAGVRT
jgi:hypothetical protein